MTTVILILFLGLLSFAVIPWIAQLNQYTQHKTDLTAGGEGE
jgi:uncharacterized membrane protein YadS